MTLIFLFWVSVDICPGSQSQGGPLGYVHHRCVACELGALELGICFCFVKWLTLCPAYYQGTLLGKKLKCSLLGQRQGSNLDSREFSCRWANMKEATRTLICHKMETVSSRNDRLNKKCRCTHYNCAHPTHLHSRHHGHTSICKEWTNKRIDNTCDSTQKHTSPTCYL